MKREPVEMVRLDVAPGRRVVRGFPFVIDADDREAGDLEQMPLTKGLEVPDRPDRGEEDGQTDLLPR